MKKRTSLRVASASALGLAVLITSDISVAQRQIEEVIVTARKRQESIQDVPISITALSGAEIQEAGLLRLQDISSLVPNMTYLEANSNKFTNVTLRGISSGGGLGNDPAIGVYIDDIYIGRDSGFNSDLLDIERIEVLKGPQGTLFGRNTTVGAINITTKRPSEELEGQLLLDMGNYDYRRIGGLISGPLSDNVSAKLSVVDTERDGFLDNSFGGTANTVDYTMARGQLLWEASDRLEFMVTASYREDSGDGNNYVTQNQGEAVTFSRDVSIPDIGFEDVEDTMLALHATYEFDGMLLTSITGRQELEESYVNDQDWSPLDDLTGVDSRDMEAWSQELRLESTGDNRLDWIVGLYYYQQDFDVSTQSLSGFDTIYAFFGLTDLIGSGVPPSSISPGIPDGVDISAVSTIETESYAAFANATYDFSDQWSITAGIRYSTDDRDLDYEQDATPLAAAAGFFPFTLQDEQDDDEWTPSVSLNWTPDEDKLVYASYSRGYKAGGFNNSISTTASLVSFDAETLDNYELGFKSTWMDSTLRVNMALFYMEYNDKQESRFISGVGFQQDNAGKATSEGFEMDFEWIPADRWRLFGGVGYAKAEYDDYVLDANTDFSGNTLSRAPEWTANIGFTTDWNFTNALAGDLRVDYTWQDDFFLQPNNDPFFTADSQGILNARLGLSTASGNWRAALWGRNLTDEDNINNFFGASSFVFPLYHYALIAPRTYGAELVYNF